MRLDNHTIAETQTMREIRTQIETRDQMETWIQTENRTQTETPTRTTPQGMLMPWEQIQQELTAASRPTTLGSTRPKLDVSAARNLWTTRSERTKNMRNELFITFVMRCKSRRNAVASVQASCRSRTVFISEPALGQPRPFRALPFHRLATLYLKLQAQQPQ
jgi:hypothetical protein